MKKLSKILGVALCLALVLSMLPVGASAAENYVEFTVDSLGLEDQAYTASTATVGGVGVEWIQLGNYGDGIQMRDKDGKTSMFWSTTAFAGGITKIELTYSDSKQTYNNDNCMIVNFGKSAQGADYSTTLTTTSGNKEYTITPNATDYTFFYIEWDYGYSSYWKSIKVYYNEGGNAGTTPDTPDTPDTPVTPDPTGDYTPVVALTSVIAVAVVALAVLVIGKKRVI